MVPLVSIVLPNLNYRQFLEERFHSILAQTLTDWELIVVDGYSDDGAWELIQEFARNDARIQASQAPREGIYAALNRGIQAAQGAYVYIATSDDTMSPDCLEKMVTALDAHPECEMCHCCLTVIDEQGRDLHLWDQYIIVQFYQELMDIPHIRIAPYDGMLYCSLLSVYKSLTQLVLRRSIFKKVGMFRNDWGAMGDFEWGMRAALVCNTFHLPEALATWRQHDRQATQHVAQESQENRAKLCEMILAALPTLKHYNPEFYYRLSPMRLLFFYRYEQLYISIRQQTTFFQKLWIMCKFVTVRPDVVLRLTASHIFPKQHSTIDGIHYAYKLLNMYQLERHIQRLDAPTP